MDMVSIVGLCVAAGILALVIKDYRPEYGVFIGLGVAIIVISVVLPQLAGALGFIDRYAAMADGLGARLEPLLKALGIAIIAQIGADTCRDCGENGMAGKVEIAGRVAILLVTIPLLEELLGVITSLLSSG